MKEGIKKWKEKSRWKKSLTGFYTSFGNPYNRRGLTLEERLHWTLIDPQSPVVQVKGIWKKPVRFNKCKIIYTKIYELAKKIKNKKKG